MYCSLKSDVKQERYKLGRFFVITLYIQITIWCLFISTFETKPSELPALVINKGSSLELFFKS
jgi:hypothetical protein